MWNFLRSAVACRDVLQPSRGWLINLYSSRRVTCPTLVASPANNSTPLALFTSAAVCGVCSLSFRSQHQRNARVCRWCIGVSLVYWSRASGQIEGLTDAFAERLAFSIGSGTGICDNWLEPSLVSAWQGCRWLIDIDRATLYSFDLLTFCCHQLLVCLLRLHLP